MPHHDPKLLARLSRIEGQVHGVSTMVKEGRYCIDVVAQVRAVRSALARVEQMLLDGHLKHCVEEAISSGDPKQQRQKVAELIELLGRTDR